jgi:hypothetical protein
LAQASGTVQTAQGDAMPRSAWIPSGISVAAVSAATAPEISTIWSSGRQSPSSRLTRLTLREGQGAAGERHAVLDQARAELGQEPVGVRASAGGVDQPSKRRAQLHGAIMPRGRSIVTNGSCQGYVLCEHRLS